MGKFSIFFANNSHVVSGPKHIPIISNCYGNITISPPLFLLNDTKNCYVHLPSFNRTFVGNSLKYWESHAMVEVPFYEKDESSIFQKLLPVIALLAGLASILTLIFSIFLYFRSKNTTEPATEINLQSILRNNRPSRSNSRSRYSFSSDSGSG